MGFEPTSTSISYWRLCHCLPGGRSLRLVLMGAGKGVEHHRSEFMRLGWAPAHPRIPGPGIEPSGRPYESRLGACHA